MFSVDNIDAYVKGLSTYNAAHIRGIVNEYTVSMYHEGFCHGIRGIESNGNDSCGYGWGYRDGLETQELYVKEMLLTYKGDVICEI
tara:strand:- start:2031 stop:2288 length:258 start_codon:yes stop_codon:yes gene_type:complete